MKNINLAVGGLLVLGIFIIVKPAMAEQRVKVFELAESGQTIEFRMTPEEIAAEDAQKSRLAEIRAAKLKKSKERMQIFEMSESGQTVEFPMTPEEIAAADAENDRLTALRKAQLENPKKRVVEFELSESGVIIEFPVFGAETSK